MTLILLLSASSLPAGGGLIQIPAMLILLPVATRSRFVRIFFLVIVTALIAKLAQSIIAS